jgi:5-methylcytosine-specific restriction enzyme subunit McrC
MKRLSLREHSATCGVALTAGELALLRTALPSVGVQPGNFKTGLWDLTPAAKVGSVRLGSAAVGREAPVVLEVEIRPKLRIDRLLFLLAYAANPRHWQSSWSRYRSCDDLLEAVAGAFVSLLQPVVRGGLLQGYRTREEALHGIRGRIRFADQLRRRGDWLLPVEVRYDELTLDILENQILAAAVRRLRLLPLRNSELRRSLSVLEQVFQQVSRPRWMPGRIPRVTWTPLNLRYRVAIRMARQILEASSFDLGGRGFVAQGLLVDMNQLFEEFVVTALREALGVGRSSFPRAMEHRSLSLDEDRLLRVLPDLSWWQAGRCRFVGDVKYKRDSGRGHRDDLYQLLAYALAAQRPEGFLIYGELTGPPQCHRIRHPRVDLHVVGLDLSLPPAELLEQVAELAERVRRVTASELPVAQESMPAPRACPC